MYWFSACAALSTRSNNHVAKQLGCTRLAYSGPKHAEITTFHPCTKIFDERTEKDSAGFVDSKENK